MLVEHQILSDVGEIKGIVTQIDARMVRMGKSVFDGATSVDGRLKYVEKKLSWFLGAIAGFGSLGGIGYLIINFWR